MFEIMPLLIEALGTEEKAPAPELKKLEDQNQEN